MATHNECGIIISEWPMERETRAIGKKRVMLIGHGGVPFFPLIFQPFNTASALLRPTPRDFSLPARPSTLLANAENK
jgi:hypothetical protein